MRHPVILLTSPHSSACAPLLGHMLMIASGSQNNYDHPQTTCRVTVELRYPQRFLMMIDCIIGGDYTEAARADVELHCASCRSVNPQQVASSLQARYMCFPSYVKRDQLLSSHTCTRPITKPTSLA